MTKMRTENTPPSIPPQAGGRESIAGFTPSPLGGRLGVGSPSKQSRLSDFGSAPADAGHCAERTPPSIPPQAGGRGSTAGFTPSPLGGRVGVGSPSKQTHLSDFGSAPADAGHCAERTPPSIPPQ